MQRYSVHIAPLRPALPPAEQPKPAQPAAAPIEPLDPVSSVDGRFGSRMPTRSSLSPSQRALQRHRLEQPQREGRTGYVTYTIDKR